jgi:hypothetical protein
MRTTQRMRVLLIVLALALLTGMSVASCGEEPVTADPQEVLTAASANVKALTAFHFAYTVHQPESAEKADGPQVVEGDINAAGDMQAAVTILGGGVLFNVDFVAVGDTHYVRLPISPTWQEMTPKDSPLGNLNLTTLSIQILDQIADPSYEGTGKKGGHNSYHITGTVTGADVEQIAGSAPDTRTYPTDLWVGTVDGLLYEVDIHGPMAQKEVEGTWRSIVLSNFNVPVEIRAPQ